MATWTLSTEYKKNALEVQLWYKDGITIRRIEGYRWGSFFCESDERPDVDLRNSDGEYQLDDSEYDWELDSLDDGCWVEWQYPDEVSEEDQAAIEAAWDENWYEGLESLGWSNDDTEYYFQGPMKLVNQDTGEEISVLDENFNIIPEAADPEAADPEVTDWFPSDVNPVHKGRYEINNTKNPLWPFPTYADWDGDKWSDASIAAWRGLAENPNK